MGSIKVLATMIWAHSISGRREHPRVHGMEGHQSDPGILESGGLRVSGSFSVYKGFRVCAELQAPTATVSQKPPNHSLTRHIRNRTPETLSPNLLKTPAHLHFASNRNPEILSTPRIHDEENSVHDECLDPWHRLSLQVKGSSGVLFFMV